MEEREYLDFAERLLASLERFFSAESFIFDSTKYSCVDGTSNLFSNKVCKECKKKFGGKLTLPIDGDTTTCIWLVRYCACQ